MERQRLETEIGIGKETKRERDTQREMIDIETERGGGGKGGREGQEEGEKGIGSQEGRL